MRGDLNTLADTYDLPGIGGGWQGPGPGGPGGGAGQVNPPSWAQGTFYGRDQSGRYLTLSITANGAVTLNTGGQMSTGSYLRSDNMTINGVMHRAVRQGNNIVVTNMAAGESVNFSRTGGPAWGGGQPGWGGGQQGNVPSWALGTWYGTNPQTGGGWALTINNNGTVVYSFDSGATQQGSIYGDRLTILGVEYRVTRISNGIRTTNVDNGSRLDFYNRRR
ncbi:MAG: hypothetical protein H0V76_05795, partial [Blastocatellia bacterium]|nr:hypothetical protein [Blastocatellia bacterium]